MAGLNVLWMATLSPIVSVMVRVMLAIVLFAALGSRKGRILPGTKGFEPADLLCGTAVDVGLQPGFGCIAKHVKFGATHRATFTDSTRRPPLPVVQAISARPIST